MRHTVETPNASSDQPPSGAGDFDTLVNRPAVRGATIMAVTNGTRASGAALKLAAELSERDGEWLEVLTVERPFPAAVEGFCFSADVVRTPDRARGDALRAVTDQLVALMKGDRWSLRVEFGPLAPTIVRAAKEQKAKLIILGRGERKGLYRTIDADTVAHVLQ
jgi:nucleotide-binding universal stress UspA family protein